MNKRGQFYIIAAVLIIVIVSSITAVTNYAITNPSPKPLESLSNNLEQEGPRIVDYGIYTRNDVNNVLNNFTSNDFAPYFLKKTNNPNIVFVYGNKTNLYGVVYNLTSTGTITASIGGQTTWDTTGIYAKTTIINPAPGSSSVNVTMLGKTFQFDLRNNEMFYFVIMQQKQGETYIKKN
jgi:hypothetical protein